MSGEFDYSLWQQCVGIQNLVRQKELSKKICEKNILKSAKWFPRFDILSGLVVCSYKTHSPLSDRDKDLESIVMCS